MTTIAEPQTTATAAGRPRLLWLDLTRKCQLNCGHCYNGSGPEGTHGDMTAADWFGVLDQAASAGIHSVQFIGGEPTMHPDAPELVDHALNIGLKVEVFSNLVHVTPAWWDLFRRGGVSLATSYYSNHASEHNAMTARRSHARTRANIETAVKLGIRLRVGIIVGDDDQHFSETLEELQGMGVTRIGTDRVRPFGRAAHDQAPDAGNLCGQCGSGRAAVGPNGAVSPCVFSGWLGVGNVHDAPLADILGGDAMAEANASIRNSRVPGLPGNHDGCEPDDECSPGTPLSDCNPRT